MPNKRQHYAEEKAQIFIKAGVAPYLVGPTGSGKTTLVSNIANKLGLAFYYASGVDSEYKLKGFTDAHGSPVLPPFAQAYEKGGLFFFDEIDTSNAMALTTAHAALDNCVLDGPNGMIKRHKNFKYIAAANTYGHGATLDYISLPYMGGRMV